MAKKKEEPKVDNEVGKLKVKEKVEKQPDGNETKNNVTKVKQKMKMKPLDMDKETITKVDLSKPPKTKEDAVQESEAERVDVDETSRDSKEVGEEKPVIEEITVQQDESVQDEEAPIVEEITNEEKVDEVVEAAEEAIIESIEQGTELPENIQKLMDFMEDTGGDINDYVTLNQDYSELDNHTLLKEYYKSTKPHLTEEEVDFVMEDTFAYDEESDDDREVKRKKLAMKEQVAQAKQHLESVKSKYYEDIKMGSKLTKEQQEAIEFFNKYNEESERDQKFVKEQVDHFDQKTNNVFNDKFKGFEYNIGEKKFRFNVKNRDEIKESQSDINNFIKKFLNKDMKMEDANGYHKSLYTAMNADQIANHFYEQGKADAIKDSIAKSKNVDMSPRQTFSDDLNANGIKVRVLDDEGPDFKFKIKNK